MVVAGLDFPGPPSAGPPKISLFFFPFPPPFPLFLSLSGVFSLNFGGVFEDRDPQMCTFGLSGCRVKPRRPHQTGPPGLAHDSPNSKRAQTRGTCASKHHQNSTRRPPERHRNSETVAGREEKARNFGPPTLRGPTLSGPHPFGAFGAPLFLGLGSPPINAPPFGAPFWVEPREVEPRWVKHLNTKIGQTKSVWPKSVNTLKH